MLRRQGGHRGRGGQDPGGAPGTAGDRRDRHRGAGQGRPGSQDDPLDAAQQDRVRAVLALGGVPYADLPDGVQQVRLRLLERAAQGHEAPRDLSAWAAVVASNLAMDWHRARRRQERLGERLAALRQEPPQYEDTRVLAVAVAQGLDALPAPQRQVVVLRFYADLSVRGIADELGIPEGTVKSRLHTAVRALRAQLHEEDGDAPPVSAPPPRSNTPPVSASLDRGDPHAREVPPDRGDPQEDQVVGR